MINLSLQKQLFAAFAGLALLVIVVGSIGAFGSRTIGDIFTNYRGNARESLSVTDLNIYLIEARSLAFQWRSNPDPQLSEAFLERIDSTLSEAQSLGLGELANLAQEYRQSFQSAVSHQDERERQVAILAQTGPGIRSNLTQVIQSAYGDGDDEASYLAATAQEKLMLGRFYAERFQQDQSAAVADRARAELASAADTLQDMLASLQNPTRLSLANDAASDLQLYQDAFDALVRSTELRNNAMGDMDAIGPRMAELTEVRRQAVVDTQNRLGPEGEAATRSTERFVLLAAIVSVLIAAITAFFLATGISGAIKRVITAMRELSNGNKTLDIKGTERADEIGDMARALVVFRDNALEVDRLAAEQEAAEERAATQRREAMLKLADEFETQIGAVITSLTQSSDELGEKSQTLSYTVDAAGQRSTSVAAAAEQASTSVESVASAAEELTASIREVASQVAASSNAARTSSEQAAQSTSQLDRLSKAVTGVDQIVKSINEVAEQTNLLALNATIEAARAGEAGKGFAVVAEEVKQLATQTQKLTEEIAKRLAEIGSSSDDAIKATQSIINQISEINETTSALAAAVEEQTTATSEISQSAQQAADGTRSVSADIASVQTSVAESSTVAESVDQAAGILKSNSDRLRSEVDNFLKTVRAA